MKKTLPSALDSVATQLLNQEMFHRKRKNKKKIYNELEDLMTKPETNASKRGEWKENEVRDGRKTIRITTKKYRSHKLGRQYEEAPIVW